MSFFENTRKPAGLGGKIMVAMMNFGHSAMAEWGLHFLQPAPDAMVLDCGCGGGANIKKLLKLCPKGKVQGIDYSAVSVEKARKVNAGAIAEGRCNVQQASVAELPFEAEQFDVATAFETVYFWPELAQNFREVYRVLKPGGTFFICNEANGETAKDDKWTQIINGMTIYTDADLKVYLEQAGFGRVQSHKNKKGLDVCHSTEMRCDHVEKGNGISKKSNELDVPGQGNLQAFEHRLDRRECCLRARMGGEHLLLPQRRYDHYGRCGI